LQVAQGLFQRRKRPQKSLSLGDAHGGLSLSF
jgi:hypothetical protein